MILSYPGCGVLMGTCGVSSTVYIGPDRAGVREKRHVVSGAVPGHSSHQGRHCLLEAMAGGETQSH